jgi:hypothetical protein
MVLRPEAEGEANLLEIIDTVDSLRLFFGRGERRQEHGRQNRDDRDDDEQFDKRERFFGLLFHIFCFFRELTCDYTDFAGTVNRVFKIL